MQCMLVGLMATLRWTVGVHGCRWLQFQQLLVQHVRTGARKSTRRIVEILVFFKRPSVSIEFCDGIMQRPAARCFGGLDKHASLSNYSCDQPCQ